MRHMFLGIIVAAGAVLSLACEAQGGSTGKQSVAAATPPAPVSAAPVVLQSLMQARDAVGFQLRIPTLIPTGFALEKIEHFVNREPKTPQIDRLRVWYRSNDGDYLLVEQGSPMGPEDGAYRFAPSEQKGSATVQGQSAIWVRGRARMTDHGPQWEPGPLSLRWGTGPMSGYALESESLTLDQLVAIADSVQTYRP